MRKTKAQQFGITDRQINRIRCGVLVDLQIWNNLFHQLGHIDWLKFIIIIQKPMIILRLFKLDRYFRYVWFRWGQRQILIRDTHYVYHLTWHTKQVHNHTHRNTIHSLKEFAKTSKGGICIKLTWDREVGTHFPIAKSFYNKLLNFKGILLNNYP